MGECGDNWRFKIEEEHKRKNPVVRDNHKIKIGGMGMKDIQKINKVDGEVKGVGIKGIQKKNQVEGEEKRSVSEQHPNT